MTTWTRDENGVWFRPTGAMDAPIELHQEDLVDFPPLVEAREDAHQLRLAVGRQALRRRTMRSFLRSVRDEWRKRGNREIRAGRPDAGATYKSVAHELHVLFDLDVGEEAGDP